MILVFKHENVQIENIENLKIIEYIKEFDIKIIYLKMNVIII